MPLCEYSRSPTGSTEGCVAVGQASASATQANVSKHLALLADGGVLARRKNGQYVYYAVKDKLAVKLCELVRAQLSD